MGFKTIAKLGAMLMLGGSLAGCIDATVDVDVTSETTAKATLTQVMSADFYAMFKMNNAESDNPTEFCSEGDLVENADGSATCTLVEEGTFAELAAMEGEENALFFTPAGPGLVRVALPTAELTGELGSSDDMDAETKQMVEAFFTGHAVTIRISGAEVTETNLERSDDRTSAEIEIPFLDLINGTADLPDELFAVVRAK
ncbi:hypothetical protein JP75_05290 [Devosia riboflavina]|uniref:Lipoprotein n=1 Tax=Devosia riboflavina TaxID=46914 RepID=A0A087M655_9HYPH|nr:hypothetical protein [Devosia riboflavina]KFL32358.1 hypothetical protein JP75_05290 [Devosia riboflavina]